MLAPWLSLHGAPRSDISLHGVLAPNSLSSVGFSQIPGPGSLGQGPLAVGCGHVLSVLSVRTSPDGARSSRVVGKEGWAAVMLEGQQK